MLKADGVALKRCIFMSCSVRDRDKFVQGIDSASAHTNTYNIGDNRVIRADRSVYRGTGENASVLDVMRILLVYLNDEAYHSLGRRIYSMQLELSGYGCAALDNRDHTHIIQPFCSNYMAQLWS